ncbi:MAG: hypothetical protein J0H69_11010 [Burkholderiales bacterium]|jgi:hypothetical protein|nr:hypothetical protein [Burkholderiales bacterium]
MWKIAVGFVIFAAAALYFISQAGDKIEMGGEKHSGDIHAKPAASAPAAGVAPAAPVPAPAASAP